MDQSKFKIFYKLLTKVNTETANWCNYLLWNFLVQTKKFILFNLQFFLKWTQAVFKYIKSITAATWKKRWETFPVSSTVKEAAKQFPNVTFGLRHFQATSTKASAFTSTQMMFLESKKILRFRVIRFAKVNLTNDKSVIIANYF
jgi:hypothetical protein